jgi:hypothetical protein
MIGGIMKNLNKYLALLFMIVLANFSNSNAQTESITIKGTGKVKILGTGAVLKINSDQGRIRTENTTDNLENLTGGKIELNGTNNIFTAVTDGNCDLFTADDAALAYGNSATARVPGLVSYNGAAVTQDIQVRFYSDLEMAGTGAKTIPTGVAVSGAYTAPGTGNRDYTGNFTYDGTTDQTILGETTGTGGGYDNVVLQNAGVKTLADATTADMQNMTIDPLAGNVIINGTMNVAIAMTQPTPHTLNIDGGIVSLGTGASVLAGTVNIGGTTSDQGTLTLDGAGGRLAINGATSVNEFGNFNIVEDSVTVGTAGTLALGNFPSAKIDLAANSKLEVIGSFTNANPIGDNATFNVSSSVNYSGIAGQLVMGTTEANPYGNLKISAAGEKTVATGDSLVAAGNFALADANFNLGNCVPGQFLWLTDPTKSVTYGNGIALSGFEVVGSFRRSINGNTTALPFNNYATTVALSTPTDVNWIELCVNPGATSYYSGYDADKDVKRTIRYKYDVDAASINNWSAEIAYGYKTTELESPNNNDGFKNSLRFRETDGSTLDEKVSTNSAPVRTLGTDPFSSVRLAAIRETGRAVAPQIALAEVADDNLLFLRGGPAEFISVRAGRWSNPATWDEGEQPGATDIVKIRNNVHIGFVRTGIDNFAGNENDAINTKSGGTYPDRRNIAAKIIVNDEYTGTGTGTEEATLIIGGDRTNANERVGITRFATNDPLALLIPDSGTLVIKDADNKQFFTDKTNLDTKATDMLASTILDEYNHGVVILSTAGFITRNNICIEGAFNIGGEVNVDEGD